MIAERNFGEQCRDPLAALISAFHLFINDAAAAQQQDDARARDLWMLAASRLFATDDASINTMTQQLLEIGRPGDAEIVARAFARLYPQNPDAHFRVGLTLQMAGRHDDALVSYRLAYAIDPDVYSLRNNMAAALIERNKGSEEAETLLRASVEKTPEDANCWINLAKVQLARFDLASALESSARAVAAQPDNHVIMSNYAQTLREAGKWDEAEQFATQALRLSPGKASYLSNLSMIHLTRGNYADGWREHEARWEGSRELAGKRPILPGAAWRGESLAGKTLLLWGEQGMGDLIQFCRYVPMLAQRVHREGGRLVWNSFPQIGTLLARTLARHADEFSVGGGVENLPPFDYEIGLVSLPLMFDTREETIPANVPYLRADAGAVKTWRKRLSREKRLKVGLVWTGSLTHQRNPFRRVGLERYAQHFGKLGDVAFYSLQPGADADVARAREAGFDIVDHTAEFRSFDDTAAFVEALDLVITVCTSVAHLSGALGQRTWVLLDVNPHWMWLLDRTDSPWYPSATLYRQKAFVQWDDTFDSVTHDLRALAKDHAQRD